MSGSILRGRMFQCVIYCLAFSCLCCPLIAHFLVKFGVQIPGIISSDYRLRGFTSNCINQHRLSFDNISDRSFQQNVECYANNSMPFRSLLIRFNNQLYYSILNKSYMYNQSIIIGKNGCLYERGYIDRYKLQRNNQSVDVKRIEDSAIKIKKLQDFFESRGQVFLYIITPSKAEYCPEFIPDRFQCNEVSIPSKYNQFVEALDKHKAFYVDGFNLVMQNKYTYDLPLFPEKGTHWNQLGAALATGRIIECIKERGGFLIDDFKYQFKVSDMPRDIDRDLLDLANLLLDYRYPVAEVTVEPNRAEKHLRMAVIAGSFIVYALNFLLINDYVESIDYFNYFDTAVFHQIKHHMDVKNPADYPDKRVLYDPLFKAEIVLLEENISSIGSGNLNKLYDFIFSQGS
jgi:alginate O-acetyltransferase complex protein AlgJ